MPVYKPNTIVELVHEAGKGGEARKHTTIEGVPVD